MSGQHAGKPPSLVSIIISEAVVTAIIGGIAVLAGGYWSGARAADIAAASAEKVARETARLSARSDAYGAYAGALLVAETRASTALKSLRDGASREKFLEASTQLDASIVQITAAKEAVDQHGSSTVRRDGVHAINAYGPVLGTLSSYVHDTATGHRPTTGQIDASSAAVDDLAAVRTSFDVDARKDVG